MARQPPKCCCCVPLRPGLLAWAYIKLVLALIYIGGCIYLTTNNMPSNVRYTNYLISQDRSPVVFLLGELWPMGASLVYLVFSIIFAIGVHRQNSKLLLVFLVYSFFEVIIAGVIVGWQVNVNLVEPLSFWYIDNPEKYDRILQNYIHDPMLYLQFILQVVPNMLLPIYFSVLIKSEVQRLKRARGETRFVLDNSITKEQDKIYNLDVSNETPVRGKPLFPVEELERLRQQLGVKNV